MPPVSRSLTRAMLLAASLTAVPAAARAADTPALTDAQTTLASLKSTAAAEHKNILLIFSASWCGPCHLLEHFLQDPAIRPIVDRNFTVSTLDVGERPNDPRHHDTPGAVALRASLAGSADPGYPYFVMLAPSGKRLTDSVRPDPKSPAGENIGYPAVPAEIDWFMTMLHRSAPALTPTDANTIETWLKSHSPAH